MKLPLILAHGQEILAFIFCIGGGAVLIGSIGLVAGLRKKDEVSRVGVACAVLTLLVGASLAWWHGWSQFLGWLSLAMLLPLPIGAAGLILSLKRQKKEPNQ